MSSGWASLWPLPGVDPPGPWNTGLGNSAPSGRSPLFIRTHKKTHSHRLLPREICWSRTEVWRPSQVDHNLVVQWLRIHLPMQGTWVQSLTGKLRSHVPQSNEAQAPPLLRPHAAVTARRGPQSRPPKQEKPPQGVACMRQLEKSPRSNEDPAQPKGTSK